MQHALDRFLTPGWTDSREAKGCDTCDTCDTSDADTPYRSWIFTLPDGSIESRTFTPPVCKSTLLAWYPAMRRIDPEV